MSCCPLCEAPVRDSEFNRHLSACVVLEFMQTNHVERIMRRALGEELQANAPVEVRMQHPGYALRDHRAGSPFE